MVKNKIIMSSTSALAGMAIGYMIKKSMNNQESEIKDDSQFEKVLKNAGMPDQVESEELDQLENAKMVSEGSQFGVQYYNETREDEDEYDNDVPKME